MKDFISRIRAQRAKSRDRAEKRAPNRPFSLQDSPWIGALIAASLWLLSVVLLESSLQDPSFVVQPQHLSALGRAILVAIGLLACGLMVHVTRPELVRRNSRLLLLASICAMTMLLRWVLMQLLTGVDWISPQGMEFLVPLFAAPLLATMLLGPMAGMTCGLWTSLTLAVFSGNPIILFVAGLSSTAIGVSEGGSVRTRGQTLKLGLTAGLVQTVAISASVAIEWRDASIRPVFEQMTACITVGFISSTFVLLILPAFETAFGVVTDIRLLELSDLGHPLLQRLALEAPGTYHHSLVVANLAQDAANRIGANPLLARVCSYFHDIGKLTKPEFFVENLAATPNPHDRLPPSMSKLIITSHVKEGISLAQLHKLPKPVLNVIREHHGTSLVTYFHQKARSQMELDFEHAPNSASRDKPEVDEEHYRYQGPTPTFKESTIVSLADAVEAASRSLEKVTPGGLEDLVAGIINARIEDEQFVQSDLTLEELGTIRRSFVFTLSTMLHRRIAYPKDERSPG